MALADYGVVHFSADRPSYGLLPTTGHTRVNAVFQGLGGVRMPPSLQEGNKRAYNAKQGLSRFRGRMGAVTSKALLPLADTPAHRIQLQLVELPLVEPIRSHLRR